MTKRKLRPIGREQAYPQGAVVRLDWRAYFREFCERHGRWPLVYKGRLLFPDGWTYSRTDHAGPEWPPPADEGELKKLLSYYWNRRLRIVAAERDRITTIIQELESVQARMSAPLQQVTGYWDAEAQGMVPGMSGAYIQQVGPVDFRGLRERLKWLREDADKCEQMCVLVSDNKFQEALTRAMEVGV